jgi:beta-lactamase class A
MTTLLAGIWEDTAASADACREMRRLLGLQVSSHRLAAGFAADSARVAAKSATLLTLRHEVGVVESPDGRNYAAAVFTRSLRPRLTDPAADAAIGEMARLAVDHIRDCGATR